MTVRLLQASARTLRALSIIRMNAPIRPREFAEMMWPDSVCWSHAIRINNRSLPGGGMMLAGGGYLGKLRRWGLVDCTVRGYVLTDSASRWLAQETKPMEVKSE